MAQPSGEVDLIDPVPLQDMDRVKARAGLKVTQAPESRIIFLGFDQARDELLYSSVKGKSPFKDVRVRQAMYQAIDIDTIASKVMRGLAVPTGAMITDGIRGFSPDMARRLPFDPAASRRWLQALQMGECRQISSLHQLIRIWPPRSSSATRRM
jgi:peptide/nickel transport system substrate-binding protein